MIPIIFVVLGFVVVYSNGFLLDGSMKSPQAELVMTDSHFTTLMTLFLEERKSREQLQKFVLQLKQELTRKVDSVGNCHCEGPDITDQINNDTNRLQNELDFLRKDFNSLQLQCAQFDKRLSSTENTTGRLQHDMDDLKQLKGVADFQAVINLENKTNHLEVKVKNTEQSIQTIMSSVNAGSQHIIVLLNKIKATDNMTLHLENELQKSNSRLNTVVSDINSRRKQDVIALVNKIEATNHQLKSLEVLMKNETHTIESKVTVKLNQSITAVKWELLSNVQHLQSGLNDTLSKLDKISNRVVLSAWLSDITVASSAIIPFKYDLTSQGIHNLTSFRNEGKFTCEKPGFYLISGSVNTDTHSNGYYDVIRNYHPIARAFRLQQPDPTTVAVVVTVQLNTNDTVFLKNGPTGRMDLYNTYDSTLSIIQIG